MCYIYAKPVNFYVFRNLYSGRNSNFTTVIKDIRLNDITKYCIRPTFFHSPSVCISLSMTVHYTAREFFSGENIFLPVAWTSSLQNYWREHEYQCIPAITIDPRIPSNNFGRNSRMCTMETGYNIVYGEEFTFHRHIYISIFYKSQHVTTNNNHIYHPEQNQNSALLKIC